MKLLKHLSKIILVIAILVLAAPTKSMAWGGGSHNNTCHCGYHTHQWWCWYYGCSHFNCGGGNDIPLDGGLSFLAIAGVGLGVKKVADRKNKKKNEK